MKNIDRIENGLDQLKTHQEGQTAVSPTSRLQR